MHPLSYWLDEQTTSCIRKWASDAELNHMLHEEQLHIIYNNKWFKLFVPKQYGGLSLSLPEALRIEEALSWADGSTGWVVTLCAGAGWFTGFINAQVVAELCAEENFCIAGSGALSGYANVHDNGYLLHGSWNYASGSTHATAFTVNCLVKKNNEQQFNADGTPRVVTFILRREEVTIKKTWNAMGMIATGSHSFEVKNVSVPFERSFIVDRNAAVIHDHIYQYPFLQFAEATLAVNISGMAFRFIELSEEIFKRAYGKERINLIKVIETLNEAKHNLNESRTAFFNAVHKSWGVQVSQNSIPAEVLSQVSEESHRLVQYARKSVNTLYPYCGLRATFMDTEINRVWRNINTAAQHALFIK